MEHPELLMLDVPLFLATCGSITLFYITAHRDLYGSRWQAVKQLPAMMALGIGLSINNGRAALEGIFGRDVEFVRTPKRGVLDGEAAKPSRYRARWPWHNVLEILFGLYCALTLTIAVVTRSWASVPFVLLFCVGFLYVGCVSLYEAVRPRFRHRDAEAQLPSTHSSPRPQSMLS